MFQDVQNVHVIGIGGIGVSAVAQWLHALGKNVTGCDSEDSPWIADLQKTGIRIKIGHDAAHLDEKPDLLIHSLAIPKDHLEIKTAKKLGIKVMSYPEALGEFTKRHLTIAVCGTHGKTTTTAMLAKIFIENKYDPNVVIGTRSPDLGNNNLRLGKSKLLIIEACEYQNAFLNYSPKMIVATNIEHDHFDAFPKFSSYLTAFKKFAEKLPQDGFFFGNADDPNIDDVMAHLKKKRFPDHNLFTFGTEKAFARFLLRGNEIFFDEKKEGDLSLKIPGIHNRMNALASFAMARIVDMAPADILYALDQYNGSGRRLELKGIVQKVRIYDDYAHHPTEIKATLQALRELHPKEKICVVYQPHQYSRTKQLLSEFSESFGLADMIIIPNIYAARDSEKAQKSVSTSMLCKAIKKHNPHVMNGENFDKTAAWLKKHLKDFDVILTMGAGDVWKVAEKLK